VGNSSKQSDNIQGAGESAPAVADSGNKMNDDKKNEKRGD
jgi:hypothetical protein